MPDLAVIVASQGEAAQTERCIKSLLEQTNIDANRLELIVCEGPPHAASNELRSRFPSVQFISCDGTSIPELHGAGIAQSKSDLVGITEGHCSFAPDWAVCAINSHAADAVPVIGGAVRPVSFLDEPNLGLFICDYAQFVPPMANGFTSDLPGNNIVFKRDSLGDTAGFAQKGFWKTFYCKELENAGYRLLADDSMVVFYGRQLVFNDIMRRRYNHGRCFGGMRAMKSSFAKRAACFFAGPVLPFILFWKLFQRCSKNVDNRHDIIRTLKYCFAWVAMWAWGEWIGNLFGPADCCSKL